MARLSPDSTDVDDIARGTVAALKPRGFDVINLGSDRPLVLNDAIRLIESIVGRQALIKFEPAHAADVTATWANIDRARERLGWEPQVSHEQGVERAIEWYNENRDWAREIQTG